ncbi:type II secretion system F family protein [Prosthecomicrobium sp. N25]|uniref:type II secretion system F family protein n=1 Tax=Prosthecomicrobium sp. N25 TaxID=3129254 RepID=UPI003076E31B
MPSLKLDELDPSILVSLFVAAAVVLVVEAVYLLVFKGESYRDRVNRRLRILGEKPNREEALVILRRERGLTGEGLYLIPVKAFNRLVLQSGTTLGIPKVLAVMVATGLAAAAGLYVWRHDPALSAGGLVAGGLVLPLLVLRTLRKRRLDKFAAQFPDAIDIIVRSLKAGHPVPVAISMVAREMGDPVGTEFGMLADEVTYGSDLETAMRNLLFRVGQEDLPLFVTAVAIQGSTGGNLAQILANLSRVIRERFKMRRKIRALSSEGRFSALALSAMPVMFFGAVNYMNPGFYGDIIHLKVTQTALGIAIGWMLTGNLIMKKMINFKI